MAVIKNRRNVPRPNIRCRRPPPEQEAPDPGTVAVTTEGIAVVYVGDTPGLVDAEALAPQLRQAREVTLVGDIWGVARPFKQQLLNTWTAATRARQAASKSSPAPKAPPTRCGRPRKDGEPCRTWAGSGTDTPGTGPCRAHGGSTARRDAEARRQLELALTIAEFAGKSRTAPLGPEERLQAAVALRDLLTLRPALRGGQFRSRSRSTPKETP
ncbi:MULTISPECIES: hypothetical protein [unclassified Streptomyces]|uniref:hypothetical protein n=1 Tax=unclassified Streptomyces TaxID=2593676 RepID=UPI0037F629E0